MLKGRVWNWIEENKQEFIDVADEVWKFAEIGLVETESSKLVAKKLEEHGFKVDLGVAGMPTAIYATWGDGEPILGFQGEFVIRWVRWHATFRQRVRKRIGKRVWSDCSDENVSVDVVVESRFR